jgi:two-component system NtrC family sensor kinase
MRSLSAKLIALLVTVMVAVFALLGYLNIRLHRQHLEQNTLAAAERVSDVIKRSSSYSMLHNDRDGLYRIITTMANEPGMERIRIFNQEGRISFSSEPAEVNSYVDKSAEACTACHSSAEPLTHLDRPDRFRIYRSPKGYRVLGIINPIENQPSCWSAACHAHPAEQKILGVLDTNLSLARADADLAESSRLMLTYTLLAVVAISLLTGGFVWRVVHGPLKRLRRGTEALARGELGYQIPAGSRDELGELAASFNAMSRGLDEAHREIQEWTRTLESRVAQKSAELRRIHEQMLQAEKMASLGKLAAVVAHEINNPLAGILTYAKLLRKWMAKLPEPQTPQEHARAEEIRSSLELIESESRRCGEIVRNLLMFARAAPMNLEYAQLNQVADRCLRLVAHQLELANVQLEKDLHPDLPPVYCDASQIEQVLLALVMNAIEAMPHGGVLAVRSSMDAAAGTVTLQVRDDGIGIPAENFPKLFEPFFTTKEGSHGSGLGLAVAKGIVERHGGHIAVTSEVGRGTTFVVTLPAQAAPAISPDAASAATRSEQSAVPAATKAR